MPTIIDGSGSATFQTPLPLSQGGTGITTFQIPVPLSQGGTGITTFQIPVPLSQGGTGNTTGNVTSSQVAGALNATGSAPLFACRAWVNFNGQGTVAIRASGNVSSITDNGTGDYTVNFTTVMQDDNYSSVCSGGWGDTVNRPALLGFGGITSQRTTSALRVFTVQSANYSIMDSPTACVAIFR